MQRETGALTTHKVSDKLDISPPAVSEQSVFWPHKSRDAMRNSTNEEFHQSEG